MKIFYFWNISNCLQRATELMAKVAIVVDFQFFFAMKFLLSI